MGRTRRSILPGVIVLATACGSVEVERLAERYVKRDTTGEPGEMDNVFALTEDMRHCESGIDGYQVIKTAQVGKAHATGDSVRVPIAFDVLGPAHTEYPHQGSSRHWGFSGATSVWPLELVAGPDPAGNLRFSCWLLVVPNYMTAACTTEPVLALLDSGSRPRRAAAT